MTQIGKGLMICSRCGYVGPDGDDCTECGWISPAAKAKLAAADDGMCPMCRPMAARTVVQFETRAETIAKHPNIGFAKCPVCGSDVWITTRTMIEMRPPKAKAVRRWPLFIALLIALAFLLYLR